jgi:hypothetical protein
MIFSACGERVPDALEVEYYYYNTCASCEPEKEFMEDFESITGISRVSVETEVSTYNIFSDTGEKAWKKTAKKFGLSEEADFPVIKIGNEIIRISDLPDDIDYEDQKAYAMIFISSNCSACEEAGDTINSMIPEKVTIDGFEVETKARTITLITSEDKALFKKYCEAYCVKEEMRVTPIVFVGRTALSGNKELEKLGDYINSEAALSTKILK